MSREITSLTELDALSGFDPNYLLTPEGFSSVERPIRLPNLEGICQVRNKHGRACREKFKNGYALRAKCGAAGAVGSSCGPTHFGIEAERLRAGFALANNRARHARAQDDLRAYLLSVNERIDAVRTATADIERIRRKVAEVIATLGAPSASLLRDAAKLDRPSIDTTGIVYANSDRGISRRVMRVPVGTLDAHEYGSDYAFIEIANDLRTYWRQCKDAKALDASSSRTSEITKANAMFSRLPSLLEKANRANVQANRFLRNDFTSLCFLIERPEDRRELAFQALRLRNHPAIKSRTQAEAWLADKLAEIVTSSGVDRILFNDSWRAEGLQVASSVPKGKF